MTPASPQVGSGFHHQPALAGSAETRTTKSPSAHRIMSRPPQSIARSPPCDARRPRVKHGSFAGDAVYLGGRAGAVGQNRYQPAKEIAKHLLELPRRIGDHQAGAVEPFRRRAVADDQLGPD